jgi:hypothetical protein
LRERKRERESQRTDLDPGLEVARKKTEEGDKQEREMKSVGKRCLHSACPVLSALFSFVRSFVRSFVVVAVGDS